MTSKPPTEPDSTVRWPSVYAAVVVFTAVVVVLLYLFSNWFSG